MRHLIYVLLVGGYLFLHSCSEDDGNLALVGQVLTVDEAIAKAKNTASGVSYVADTSLSDQRNSTVVQDTTVEWEEFGPFTATPTVFRVLTNYYVILTSAEGYEDGVYLCDVYSATACVTLPEGVIAVRADASRPGFAAYQSIPRVAGPIVIGSSVNREYTIRTWSIVPKYDQLGHTLDNRPLPADPTETIFTYSYFQFI